MRVAFSDELACPIDGQRLDWADRRNGAPAFGDEQARARSHPLQVAVEVGLECANAVEAIPEIVPRA